MESLELSVRAEVESHANRGPQIQGVVIFFIVLTTVSVWLRTYCRAFIIKNFGWDDILAVISWAFFLVYSSFALLAVTYGSGQHVWDIPPEHVPIGLKYWWLCEPVYVVSNMALKLSIAVFLLRLSNLPMHRYIILGTLVVCEIGGIFYFLVFIFQCQPSNYFWTKYTGGTGKCINANIPVDAGYAYSAITCATDWILSLIPIWVVWNLQMTPRDKISVAIILAMGAVASTATIIRIPYLHDLSNIADFLFATVDIAIWSTAETGIGITACSVATLRPLFRSFFARTKMFGSSTKGPSNPSNAWGGYGDTKGSGYIKQKSLNDGGSRIASSGEDVEDFKLRDDIPLHSGVTTTIVTGKQKGTDFFDDTSDDSSQRHDDRKAHDIDLELGHERDSRAQDLKGRVHSKRISKHAAKWSGGKGRIRDTSDARSLSSEEDPSWGMGITKTINTKISSVRMSRVGGGKG
ncbi:hypothetical protein sscle_13g092820 [Sclerotinia sclerotiorum 1980 UF-70]|uniref:Rhodopsin domain-containing protein n=2 Tax=Sclerotinia sclerotiorum (strain ATCC 18683 / 1980 / Ss-1) TaxID=665079 RepID=A0A1D9QI92_SCLS1|nr:hypothetical protein sscle_13g092820 [Sclerotinia sclerotiorum 1980 UF-70]